MSRISIDTTSGRIAGRYLEPAGGPGDRAVLLVHGWTSEAQAGYLDLPDRLAEQGFAALAIDLPGHGESEGDRSRLGYREFIRAAIDSADDEMVPHQTVANHLSAAPGVDHIVLSGAIHSLRSQPDKHALAMGFTLTWLSTREAAPETPNILGAPARIYVDDIDAALPFYQALGAPDEPDRFANRGMRLAKAGAVLLVEEADDRARSHAASIAVCHVDEVVRAVNDGGGTVLDGPAPGPNGPRLVVRHLDGAVVKYVEVS